MKVYEIIAWFGDAEWSEGLWEDELQALIHQDRLREQDRWAQVPNWLEGYRHLIKSVVEEREVQ